MSAPRVYLFDPPDDAKRVDTVEMALHHSAAMSRLLNLALVGIFSEEEQTLPGDADVLVDMAQHATMWATRGLDLIAKETTPARAHEPLNEPVTYGERGADCPVCGAAIFHHKAERGRGAEFDEAEATCSRCASRMHEACYWGRAVALSEFQEYRRQIAGGPEDFAPDIVCPQCRAKGETA